MKAINSPSEEFVKFIIQISDPLKGEILVYTNFTPLTFWTSLFQQVEPLLLNLAKKMRIWINHKDGPDKLCIEILSGASMTFTDKGLGSTIENATKSNMKVISTKPFLYFSGMALQM